MRKGIAADTTTHCSIGCFCLPGQERLCDLAEGNTKAPPGKRTSEPTVSYRTAKEDHISAINK